MDIVYSRSFQSCIVTCVKIIFFKIEIKFRWILSLARLGKNHRKIGGPTAECKLFFYDRGASKLKGLSHEMDLSFNDVYG